MYFNFAVKELRNEGTLQIWYSPAFLSLVSAKFAIQYWKKNEPHNIRKWSHGVILMINKTLYSTTKNILQ